MPGPNHIDDPDRIMWAGRPDLAGELETYRPRTTAGFGSSPGDAFFNAACDVRALWLALLPRQRAGLGEVYPDLARMLDTLGRVPAERY